MSWRNFEKHWNKKQIASQVLKLKDNECFVNLRRLMCSFAAAKSLFNATMSSLMRFSSAWTLFLPALTMCSQSQRAIDTQIQLIREKVMQNICVRLTWMRLEFAPPKGRLFWVATRRLVFNSSRRMMMWSTACDMSTKCDCWIETR